MGERSLAEWLGEDAEPPDDDAPSPDDVARARPSRRWPWLLAAGAWAVVIAAVVVGDPRPATPGETGPAPDAGATTAPADPAAAEPTAVPLPGEDAERAPAAAPPPTLADDDRSVGAIAKAAAHLAVTGRTDDGVERYVEHVAVERVATIDAETSLVTVVAVVLEGGEGQWRDRAAVRLAMPVGTGGGDPVPLAAPWPLTPPVVAPARPQGEPLDDDVHRVAVSAALADAGYGQVELGRVERLRTGLWRAEIVAVPPGEAQSRPVEVWLSGDPAPVVLGASAGAPNPQNGKEHP